MKLSGIIEKYNKKNIGIDIHYDKNIIHFLRKSSNDVLYLFDIIFSMKSNILQKINQIFIYDKIIKDIILNNKIDTKNLVLNIYIPTLQIKEYLKVIENIVIITKNFNYANILLNDKNYKIDIIDNNIISLQTNYSNYYKIGKINININIKLEKNEIKDKFIYYLKFSNYYPLGYLMIQSKFIHLYYCKHQNISISHIFEDYQYDININDSLKKLRFPFENNSDYSDSDDDENNIKFKIERLQNLLYSIQSYRDNNINVKNVQQFDIHNNDECPVCYSSSSKIYSIAICKNDHKTCNLCLLKIFKNDINPKCPICRENIYFKYESDDIYYQDDVKELELFRNKLNHINFFIY